MPGSREKRGSKKARQQYHNKATGKYKRQFIRTVTRTGRWRGRSVSVYNAY